ncbi:hypothetical protein EMCRGX_G033369 [Ephydatia muelleri]
MNRGVKGLQDARLSMSGDARLFTSSLHTYSLYEPKSHALMEYNGGLEKAILRDSELLSEVNDAFCKSHPLLAQKVVTRSARAAMEYARFFEQDSEDEIHPPTPLPFTQPPPPPPLLETVLPPNHPPPAVAAALSPPPAAAELPPPAVAAELPPPLPAEAAERPPPLPALTPPPAPIPVPPPPLRLLPPWPLPPPPTWLPWPQRGRRRRRGGRGQGRTVYYIKNSYTYHYY